MQTKPLFVITLDTEPDDEWGRPRIATTENARFIPRFHELCVRKGFKVTYLMTLEMVEDEFLHGYLQPRLRAGECEVGAHLHPWNTPPLVPVTADDLEHHPYPFEYPTEIQREKLDTLVRAVERQYGVRPVSYKAGRWGLDEVHADLLEEMGFRADTSVCPGVNWGPSKGDPRRDGGPNFTTAPILPYRLSREDVCRPGSMGLWEIPPTIVFYSRWGRYVPGVKAMYRRVRKVRRLFDRVHRGSLWLRPYPTRLALRTGTPVLNMTLHSSELMPGASPYNKTEASIEDLFVRLEGYLTFIQTHGVEAATLSEAAERLSAGAVAQAAPALAPAQDSSMVSSQPSSPTASARAGRRTV